jgi:ankyrin repeat protein
VLVRNSREDEVARIGGRTKAKLRDLTELDRYVVFVHWFSAQGAVDSVDMTKVPEELAGRARQLEIEQETACEQLFPPFVRVRTVEEAEQLLASGADVNATTEWGESALYRAAKAGSEELVRWLVEHGAQVNSGQMGDTPLQVAAASGWHRIVTFLLDHKADMNVRDCYGQSPLHEVVSLRRSPRTCGEDTAPGATRDYVATVKALLDGGAELEARFMGGTTPLLLAAERGDKALVELLLARGADVHAVAEYGMTVLHFVASGKHFHSRRDASCASEASFPDYRRTAELLIARGAAVDATGTLQITPLFEAVRYANCDVAEVLLAHGANAKAVCFDGQTPLWAAERGLYGNPSLSAYLPTDEIMERTQCYEKIIQWLKERGATDE